MKIIEPKFEILDLNSRSDGIRILQKIERLARISHRSEGLQTPGSWHTFIPAVVIRHGDWSVTEHASVSVIFRVDRGVTHELVRHRLFSFTQESTRFVNGRKSYPDGLEFIMPVGGHWLTMEKAFVDAEQRYFELLDQGVRPQEARAVLPNALAATIAVTGNLRAWRWFFLARTTIETHPSFRQVSIPLLDGFKNLIPILYDDIIPEEKQSVSMARVH